MPIRRFSLLCAISAATLVFASCAKAEPSRAEFVMGTVCSVTLYDEGKAQVYRDIFSRLREIENLMSVNVKGSDIDHINAEAGKAPVQVHDDVYELIERALYFAEISGGAFDPTVGPLVSLWGIGGDNPRLPAQREIDAVLQLVNWRDVELERESRSVFLKRPGMALDLGAIAKGYAADEAAAIVRKAGLRRALIDLGGNVLTYGVKKDRSPWMVGVQNPIDARGSYIGIVQYATPASGFLPVKTVVTSGVYERNFEYNGVLYHHILSPFDGYPVRNSLLSVTIVSDSSADADALSTTVFSMGYEKGRTLIEALEDTEAVFIFDDMSVRKTSGLDFTLSYGKFRLAE